MNEKFVALVISTSMQGEISMIEEDLLQSADSLR